ncbi:hypothetical protein ABIC28_004242 [Rhodococcus sp. PvR044]|uniref:hypothetical protein n=1 Tax=Rhodococcus TaxID=1827 RepID=UPI00117AD324|nr:MULTISPECIES: hypothetical protein [Rhodococcus]MBP1159693.1 hypothetical protein [Rhodococcus sp. PvR099]MCZ4558071.1 hypothetical protein [Rhodococcus maanshanensis]
MNSVIHITYRPPFAEAQMHQDQHVFLHPAPPSAGDGNDAERIRAWRRLGDFLEQAGAVSPHARRVIDFAITWAPFGGASPAELFETFGVTPARFLTLLRESLEPQGVVPHLATLERQLSESLLRAWTGAGRAQSPRPSAV